MWLLGPWHVSATNEPPCKFYFILSNLQSAGGSWSRTGQRAQPRKVRARWLFPMDLAATLHTVPATARRGARRPGCACFQAEHRPTRVVPEQERLEGLARCHHLRSR